MKLQKSQRFSHLNVCKKLLRLRHLPALREGDYNSVAVDKDVLVYKREIKRRPRGDVVIVLLNFGSTTKIVNLTSVYAALGDKLEVLVSSIHSPLIDGDVIDGRRVELQGAVGAVLRTMY